MIERHASVRGYFHEALTAAMKNQGVAANELTEFYLVNLLAQFADASQAEERLARPLTMMLADAVETQGADRLNKFREIGDTALYISGFFADHLARRGIDRSYVVMLGGQAYGSAATLVRHPSIAHHVTESFEVVYAELARKFAELVEVLGEIGESVAQRTARDVLKLYDRWVRTRSPRLAKALGQEGLFPILVRDPDGYEN